MYRARIAGAIERNGIEQSRMQVLEALLRLRQICCHPALVEKGFDGDAAKFRLCGEFIGQIIAEGHNALLFSQFTQALDLVRAQLSRASIATEMLTGKTRNRSTVVDRFQHSDTPAVFLISLKAGGVGLNLTAADYVIHLDPWWNPTSEQQATDRAHRIGQTRPVFVYKLIMRDSVEEHVLKLQERKKEIVQKIVTEEESAIKKLSREEIMALFR
jgi:non-specific serine/threonine protein kinase